ncbi:MAG: DNA primase [Polyangia bacterium]
MGKLGLIPESKVAEIRDRTDIVAVIGEHVPLRRAGTNYLGLCPFHGEKTPSFNVSPSKQFFYCFGCQKSGDVFRFLMELEGRTFADVARDLARRAGVDIPEDSEPSPRRRAERLQEESEKARLLKLNELCARFYEVQLSRDERCQRYLRERGVSDEIRDRFRLGYAPNDWDALVKTLQQRGVPHELSEAAGLLIRREGAQLARGAPATSATHYDRFRDRAMFPLLLPPRGGSKAQGTAVCDVIAFGGRVLPGGAEGDKAGAKYINSPETPLYKKGENLFGLHAARDAIRQRRQAVLVEGNFDVLALHQFGQPVTVAPMGTALTESQVRQLARLIGPDGHLVLMLDGDKAGRAATIKDITLILLSQGGGGSGGFGAARDLDVRVARLPDGEDPDTFAQRDPEELARLVRTARPALDYVLDEAIAKAGEDGEGGADTVAGKAKVLGKLMPLLRAVQSPTVRELYVDRIAGALGLAPELVWRNLDRQPDRPPERDRGGEARDLGPVRSGRPAQGQAVPPPSFRGRGPAPQGRPAPDAGFPQRRSFSPNGNGGGNGPQRLPAPPSARDRDEGLGQPPSMPMDDEAPPEEMFSARPTASARPPSRSPSATASPGAPTGALPSRLATLARNLLALCGDHPRLLAQLPDDVLVALDSPLLEELLREARDLALAGEPVTVDQMLELAPPEARPQVAAAALSGKFIHTESPDEALRSLCRDLRAQAIQREVLDLQKALVRMNKAGQESSKQQVLLRIQELTLRRAQILEDRQDREPGPNTPGPGKGAPSPFDPAGDRTVEGDTTR